MLSFTVAVKAVVLCLSCDWLTPDEIRVLGLFFLVNFVLRLRDVSSHQPGEISRWLFSCLENSLCFIFFMAAAVWRKAFVKMWPVWSDVAVLKRCFMGTRTCLDHVSPPAFKPASSQRSALSIGSMST